MRKTKKEQKDLDLTLYTKNGTPRRRKQKTSRNYFTQETQDAIIAHNKSTDPEERNRLFEDHINYSIHKLAENIVNNFNFDYIDQSTEDIMHEVVIFLMDRFDKYKESRGKAYSYFGTIAKRYLITYNKKSYKSHVERKEMEAVDGDSKVFRAEREEETNEDINHFVKSYVRFVELGIDDIHETRKKTEGGVVKEYVTFSENDKAIVYTILDLFKNADNLEVFYKPAIYEHIRKMTGQKTVDITRVVKVLKCIMQQQLAIYHRKGCLDIDETDIYNSSINTL